MRKTYFELSAAKLNGWIGGNEATLSDGHWPPKAQILFLVAWIGHKITRRRWSGKIQSIWLGREINRKGKPKICHRFWQSQREKVEPIVCGLLWKHSEHVVMNLLTQICANKFSELVIAKLMGERSASKPKWEIVTKFNGNEKMVNSNWKAAKWLFGDKFWWNIWW